MDLHWTFKRRLMPTGKKFHKIHKEGTAVKFLRMVASETPGKCQPYPEYLFTFNIFLPYIFTLSIAMYFVKYMRRKIQVFFDSYFLLKAQNCRFSSYAEKQGSKKKQKKKKLYYGIFYRIYRKLSKTKMLIYVAFSFLQISSVKKTKISLQNKTNSHLTVQSQQYRDIRLRCEISSKLTIKTLGR